jgi:DNA-binding MarR family transcriptional regulator
VALGPLLALPLLYGRGGDNPGGENQTTFVKFASPDVAAILILLTVRSWTTTYNGCMPARPDPASLSAWRLLLEAHATVTELLEHELVAERSLPLNRYDVLLNLAEAPEGRLRMQELSESVLLSKSGLSRLVDRMVEAGLVRREQCQDDRRGWFAVLTDQGRSALRRAAPVHLRGIQEHFTRHLEPEEVQAMTAALARVVAAARATAGTRAPGDAGPPEALASTESAAEVS